jgi:iron complex transport system ATP-binding protein
VPGDRILDLHHASVVLDGACILDDLTFTIDVGEHTAILGPNGAGKSTLIRLLTLQQYPFASDNGVPPIRVFGRDRWNVFELRSRLGIVSADLHDRLVHGGSAGVMTGLDAVLSGFFASQGLFAHHTVTAEMRERARDALDRMEIAHLAQARLDRLSTGEARRVLIARALVHEPAALVLDEPTRGLDLIARHRFMERVRRLTERGTTLILVTHHVDEIVPEIGRVVLLRRGRIAAAGPKAAVLSSAALSDAFEAPLVVEDVDGYYRVRPVR